MSNWQIVGDSTISFANAAAGDVRYWWDPDNGYTKFTQVWKSDDITASNRSVFDSLTAGQRTAILAANDDTRVPAAGGVIAKASLKRQLRQYEMELSGENDTGLWYNGNWNINSIDFFSSVIDPEEKNTLMNYFSDEGTTFLDYANAANLTGVAPIKDCQVCANNVGEADDDNEGNNAIFLEHADLIGTADLEFGLTDDLITDTLKNLKYPEDALYHQGGQDFIKIKQYKYQPPGKDLITGAQGSVAVGIGQGYQRKTARKQQLGFVRLPIPNQIQDSNNVSWGPDQISNITAAVASGVLPLVNPDNINKLIQKPGDVMQAIGKNAGPKAKKFWENLSEAMQTPQAGAGIQGILGSKILNMAGFDISAESILARGMGVVPNNNMELLFNSPTLREFQFNWKMSPRSESEARQVNKIIKFFKAGMAVKKQGNIGSGTGGASYFLGTPNIFDVQFLTTGNEQIDGLMRIKECACVGCAVNYTPESNWAAYEDGQPVSVIMTLKFSELEPIYDIDYLENKPAQYKSANDIDDLPENAVGY